MKLKIRRATPSDAKDIAAIHVQTWQNAYKGLIPNDYLDKMSIPDKIKKWSEMLEDKDNKEIYLVAEIDGKVQGWASFCKCRDEDAKSEWGELGGIYVHPSAQGLGLGTALMKEGLSILKMEGYKQATLWVLTTNSPSRKFYESKGWTIEGKTKIDTRDTFELHETRYIINLF